MSANFYNASGAMTGLDLHDYWGFVPPEVIMPVPGKALYGVRAGFDGDCADEGTRLQTVTSNGKPTLQGGFARKWVKHLPMIPLPPLPPHPLEAYQCGIVYKFSSSTALLKKGNVTGAGTPLAVCVHGAFGANLNCGDPIDTISNLVHNENSVMTEPSAADFAAAWATGVVNAIVGGLVGKTIEKLFGDRLLEPIRKRLEDKLKDKLNELFQKWTEKKVRDTLASMGVTHV